MGGVKNENDLGLIMNFEENETQE